MKSRKSRKQSLQSDGQACPACGSEIPRIPLDMIHEHKDHALLHGVCPHCDTGIALLVHARDFYDAALCIATDYTAQDMRSMMALDTFGPDHVIAFYQHVETAADPLSFLTPSKKHKRRHSA